MAVHDPRDPGCFYSEPPGRGDVVCQACKVATRELPVVKEPE